MRRFESFIEVEAPVERVFDLLADFESYPRWMGGVRDVRRTGRRTSHWIAETALDFDVEWDAEVTHFEPDRRIVWRAYRGDVHADGEAVLSETDRGTTVVHYVLGYDTPGGRSGEGAAQFFGEHPKRRLERDLSRFKRLVEGAGRGGRGDGRAHAPPPAPREGRYEEGRGGLRQEAFAARPGRGDERGPRREEIRGIVRQRPRGDDYGDRHREPRRGADGERGRSFDELLGDARRSQVERIERYERESAERERERPRYAPARREFERDHEDMDERERESRWLERRGVDRLLEDPPSGRWRR